MWIFGDLCGLTSDTLDVSSLKLGAPRQNKKLYHDPSITMFTIWKAMFSTMSTNRCFASLEHESEAFWRPLDEVRMDCPLLNRSDPTDGRTCFQKGYRIQ